MVLTKSSSLLPVGIMIMIMYLFLGTKRILKAIYFTFKRFSFIIINSIFMCEIPFISLFIQNLGN